MANYVCIALSNKKRNLRKYSVVFFKAFLKKKIILRALYTLLQMHSLDVLPCDIKSNGNSERIQSVLCEDTLRVKRIIVV